MRTCPSVHVDRVCCTLVSALAGLGLGRVFWIRSWPLMVLWRHRVAAAVVASSASSQAAGSAPPRQRNAASHVSHVAEARRRRRLASRGSLGVTDPAASAASQRRGVKRQAPPVEASAASQRRRIDLPSGLRAHLAEWGPRLLAEAVTVASRRGLRMPTRQMTVGTDCSGLDAPVFALKALNMPVGFRHLFCSDVEAKKRSFLAANHPDATIYSNMLHRDHRQLPRHDMYICGFPCKPWSALHVKSKGFREQAARPFRAVCRTLREQLPVVAVLENVCGIRKVLDRVHRELHTLGWYEIMTVRVDPSDMGEPVRRPRLFFADSHRRGCSNRVCSPRARQRVDAGGLAQQSSSAG